MDPSFTELGRVVTLSKSLFLVDDAATQAAGKVLGVALRSGGVVYLQGSLGAGKTTFCKGVIAAFGYSGLVKSPTYTLVEPYEVAGTKIYHFDLYRLGDPEELEFLGVRDYFQKQNLCLIEWPEKGKGYLASADIVVELEPENGGRRLQLTALSTLGSEHLQKIETGHR